MSEKTDNRFHKLSPTLNVSSARIHYEYNESGSQIVGTTEDNPTRIKLNVSDDEFNALIGREKHPVRLVIDSELVFYTKIKELEMTPGCPYIRLTLHEVIPLFQ